MNAPAATDLGRVVTNARVRQVIYTTYVVLLVLAGATTVAFATGGDGVPTAVTVANAVLLYLGIPVGGLAAVNVGTTVAVADRGE